MPDTVSHTILATSNTTSAPQRIAKIVRIVFSLFFDTQMPQRITAVSTMAAKMICRGVNIVPAISLAGGKKSLCVKKFFKRSISVCIKISPLFFVR